MKVDGTLEKMTSVPLNFDFIEPEEGALCLSARGVRVPYLFRVCSIVHYVTNDPSLVEIHQSLYTRRRNTKIKFRRLITVLKYDRALK